MPGRFWKKPGFGRKTFDFEALISLPLKGWWANFWCREGVLLPRKLPRDLLISWPF